MAKLTVLLATLAVLLLLTEASIYRTTIEFNEDENRDRCQEQIRKEDNLRDCQEYIRQEGQSRGRRDYQEGRRRLDDCCEQLEELDSQCRCTGLEQAVKQQLQKGGHGQQSQEARKMYDVAKDVPSMCHLKPRDCQFSRPRVWF